MNGSLPHLHGTIAGAPRRRPRLGPAAQDHFIKGGAGTEKSTFWSTSAAGGDRSDSSSDDDSSSSDPSVDGEQDDWLQQQRQKLDRAAFARGEGSDVSDISTDEEMDLPVIPPPKGGGRPGRPRGPGPSAAADGAAGGSGGDGSPLLFRPKQLPGGPAVGDLGVDDDGEPPGAADGDDGAADQAPPAWMFKANAGAPNTRYLQKMEAPKKDENNEFRAKFMMNSFLVAQNAMQSFNNGLKQKRKGRKGKAAQVQKYQPKLACSFCERARKDEPPWYWSEARRRREAGEWCKREMLSDTSKVQAVGRLTLCPLHEEDMMEADSNWLEGNILLKSSVWAACEAADEARANAENRDICHRCLKASVYSTRWIFSLPDQLPAFPTWVRLLTMALTLLLAFGLAILPAIRTADSVESDGARVLDAVADYAYPIADVGAVAIQLESGTVSVVTAAAGTTDIRLAVTHSVGPTAASSLGSLETEVTLSAGVLSVVGRWTGGVEGIAAAPSADLRLTMPRSIPGEALSVEVTVGAGPAADRTAAEALSTPWSGFAPPRGDISWSGDVGARYRRVRLSTAQGRLNVTALRAAQFASICSAGRSLQLRDVWAHSVDIVSGVGTVDAEVTVTPRSSWPLAAAELAEAASDAAVGGRLAVSATTAPVQLQMGAESGGASQTAAAWLEVECGHAEAVECSLALPDSLCGDLVALGVSAADAPRLLAGFDATGVGATEPGLGELSATRSATLACAGGVGGWLRGSVSSAGAAVVLRSLPP